MTKDDFHVRVSANKAFVIFLMVFIGLFAVGFILSGLDRLPYAPLWEWGGQIVLGLGLIYALERIWRYYFLPQVSLTQTHMVVRPFWRPTQRWTYAETQGWQVSQQRIETNWRGQRLPRPITIERLIRTDKAGRVSRIVLPGFAGQNETVLAQLSARSGLAISHS